MNIAINFYTILIVTSILYVPLCCMQSPKISGKYRSVKNRLPIQKKLDIVRPSNPLEKQNTLSHSKSAKIPWNFMLITQHNNTTYKVLRLPKNVVKVCCDTTHYELEHDSKASFAEFDTDCSKLLISTGYSLYIWDMSNGVLLHHWIPHEAAYGHFIKSAHFSKNGKYLITAGTDHDIKIWDILTANEIKCFTIQERPVDVFIEPAHADTPFERYLICSNKDPLNKRNCKNYLYLCTANKGLKQVFQGPIHEDVITIVKINHNGTILITCSETLTIAWHIEPYHPGHTRIATIKNKVATPSAAAFSNDNTLLAIAYTNRFIYMYSLETWTLENLLSCDIDEPVKGLFFTSDDTLLIAYSNKKYIEMKKPL